MSESEELAILRKRVVELEMECKIAKSMLREEISRKKVSEECDEPITHELLLELGFEPDYGEDVSMISSQTEWAAEYKLHINDFLAIAYFPSFGDTWSIVAYAGEGVVQVEQIYGPKTAKELEIFLQCLNDTQEESP